MAPLKLLSQVGVSKSGVLELWTLQRHGLSRKEYSSSIARGQRRNDWFKIQNTGLAGLCVGDLQSSPVDWERKEGQALEVCHKR